VLRYTSESVGLKRIMAEASHVLGGIDRDEGKGDKAEATRIATEENHRLREIRAYHRPAGVRIGLTVYTQGMIIGLFLIALLLALVVLPLVHWNSFEWHSKERTLKKIVISVASGT